MAFLLAFETELSAVELEIETLRSSEDVSASDIMARLKKLNIQRDKLLKNIYSQLGDWQVCQVARHPQRPQSKDYIAALIDNFVELAGDRLFSEDKAIISGIGRIHDISVVVCGHQKGSRTEEKIANNFGMPRPEGYRKVLRMMNLADKFRMPIINFVDTPGAYPGIGAEERGQSGAIGACLRRSADLTVPILTVIVGEGGSGGALAMASGDYTAMMQYSIYSVISPEGCASILWKDASKMEEAAKSLGLTAPKLKKLGLIDEIISEPLGGAHRNYESTMDITRQAIVKSLLRLSQYEGEEIIRLREERWRNYGMFKVV